MPRPKLTDNRLRRWYHLLTPAMTDFDCGQLCAPNNEGVPACCDEDWTIPLLFHEEYEYHRRRSSFWRRFPLRTAEQRAEADEFDSCHDWACLCPGPSKCERNRRALVCYLYPFMPVVTGKGAVLGLTFLHGESNKCPLIERPGWAPPADYVRGSLRYWAEVFRIFPDEKPIFVNLSRKARLRYRRLGRPLPLFTGKQP